MVIVGGLPLEEKLGEGKYREVYRGSDNKVYKILKPGVPFKIGGLILRIPISLDSIIGYGFIDLNELEHGNYLKLIAAAHESPVIRSLSTIYGGFSHNGRKILMAELVRNSDGNASKTLREYGPVSESSFWAQMELLAEFFLTHKFPYFNFRGSSLIVKESPDGKIPVIVDYKGFKNVHLFPKNKSQHMTAEKIEKRFARLKQKYKP